MTEAGQDNFAYRARRDADGTFAFLGALWKRKLIRYPLILVLLAVIAALLLWFMFARDLPSADKLADYQPPLPTMMRGIDGEIVNSFARERRVQLEYHDFPEQLIHAYLAAEDKTFFEHGGLDYPGVFGAVVDYVSKLGSGQRARGGSTITQQVAKNLLLGDEYSIARKIKEAILAYRIEDALSKEEILTIYLNEIYLGRNSYGVQAAARSYFDKDVGDLNLNEMAYLAILPKGPANYRPESDTGRQRALGRRNYVLNEMEDNGWISASQRDAAKSTTLGTVARHSTSYNDKAGYFTEEVRRELIDRFGEKAEDGPYSVYAGGLWVRTSLDQNVQEAVTEALRAGMIRYHQGKGWRGPIATIPVNDGKWQSHLASSYISIDYKDWRVAAVLSRSGGSTNIGFSDGNTGTLTAAPDALTPGDLIAVSPAGGNRYRLQIIPEVSGGMVAEDPHHGRVLAIQGGFDAKISSFNRATQALRQPGSTIKPFVYATALDQGMTPATQIVDGTFCVYQSASLGQKCFRNFGGSRGAGAQTMRWGLEQSRNLMTVRAANDAGMDNVVKTFTRMGIGEYQPYLSFALGAGDTTVLKMVNAYSMLVNHGKELRPTLIDVVQDRHGKVIFRADKRNCDRCNVPEYDGLPMPRPSPVGKQLMNPMTAYQVVHMLEGVVTRGTAQRLRDLDRPLFGKTGTTSGPTNVWFVGGTPDIVAGVYLGFDQPRNMGGYAQGGTLAAPIFKQFAQKVIAPMPKTPFVAPEGIRMVRIERSTGRRIFGQWPSDNPKSAIIWEAFKPDTEPRRSIRQEEVASATASRRQAERRVARQKRGASDDSFLEEQGGIY